jgi:hypothetical protein
MRHVSLYELVLVIRPQLEYAGTEEVFVKKGFDDGAQV